MVRLVVRAQHLGFCFGVQRAVELVFDRLSQKTEEDRFFSLGPLVHNPAIVDELRRRGVEVIEDCSDVERGSGKVVIFRAHGAFREVREYLASREVEVVDGTCPRVAFAQRLVRDHSREGRRVIIAGDPDHPEVKGLVSYCEEAPLLLTSPADAESLEGGPQPTVLLSQTTYRKEEFETISQTLISKFPFLIVEKTICLATARRQQALKELSNRPEVEALVVIGSKKSANTIKLYQTACESEKPAWLLTGSPDEKIPIELLAHACIGISAGASTPAHTIDTIERELQRLPFPGSDSTLLGET